MKEEKINFVAYMENKNKEMQKKKHPQSSAEVWILKHF